MSHSKKIMKILVVANNWVQEGQGVCALFGWNLKLFAIGVRFFATSLHHTSKLFPRSQRGHEWVRNKKRQSGIINIILHTSHHHRTIIIPVPIFQIRWHSCKTTLKALGGRTLTPLARPIPSKHLPERPEGDFFKKKNSRKQIEQTCWILWLSDSGLFVENPTDQKVCSPKHIFAEHF